MMQNKLYPCPWCGQEVSVGVVRNLTKISTPCPSCNKPIRESIRQVLFVVILILPLIALILYLSKSLFDSGHTMFSVVILIVGSIATIIVQKYIPVIYDPSKGI